MNPKMEFLAAYQQRLGTFVYWPHSHSSASDIAAAGFYRKHNAPYPDVADCRECGLWLDDWRPDDVPLSEHSRRSPDCPFITKQQKLQELVKLKISKSSPVLSAQPLSSTAQPKKRSFIDEFPSKPARKKYPKSQLRQTAVTSPIPKPRYFNNRLYRTKARFFEILDEAGKLACYPYHDLNHVDPEDIFKVNYGETKALPKTLVSDVSQHATDFTKRATKHGIRKRRMSSTDPYT